MSGSDVLFSFIWNGFPWFPSFSLVLCVGFCAVGKTTTSPSLEGWCQMGNQLILRLDPSLKPLWLCKPPILFLMVPNRSWGCARTYQCPKEEELSTLCRLLESGPSNHSFQLCKNISFMGRPGEGCFWPFPTGTWENSCSTIVSLFAADLWHLQTQILLSIRAKESSGPPLGSRHESQSTRHGLVLFSGRYQPLLPPTQREVKRDCGDSLYNHSHSHNHLAIILYMCANLGAWTSG